MSEYSVSGTGQVRGARQTLKELRDLDRKLYWAAIREMKKAAEPLKEAIDSNFPSEVPMSGMDHAGVTGWNRRKVTLVKVGGKKGRNTWPLLRIIVMDAARQLFDMAGQGRYSKALEEHGYGSPSRAVWRTSQQLRSRVTNDVYKAIRDESRKVNIDLKREW